MTTPLMRPAVAGSRRLALARFARPTIAVLGPVALGLGALGAPALGAPAPAPAPAPAQDDEDQRGQWFSLPIDRGAAQGAEEAVGHIEAARWELAIEALQELIEGRPQDLLPDAWGTDPEQHSQMPHHLGAAAWARGQLALLPNSVAGLYEERFGERARDAIARALDSGSAEELRGVADRFPLALAAPRALRAAGDLAFAAGDLEDAALTWERADELEGRLGRFNGEAAAARREALAATAIAPERRDASLRLPGPDDRVGPVPRGERETWSIALPEHPFLFSRGTSYPNLVPVIHGDRVFVNTTLNLLCLDVFDGEERWRSPEPPGWSLLTRDDREDLATALDKEAQLVAPAIGSGVVVAALQIPYAALPNDDYQSFVIMRALPERRLFAFDAASGDPLWAHLPPARWDGQSGSFAERMSVAGSPTVSGPRVIVPMFRQEGRVDLHVAAFDLRTGEELWSTPIISGQRELNMFNRHEREYSAPPVRVEGDTVLVATHLGTVAALDLFNGAVHWQATYDQIPLPKTTGMISNDRPTSWKNAPPVVADGVVVATPLDSRDLLGIDLEDGALLWSQPRDTLRPRRLSSREVDVLIGAGPNEVYLGGEWIATWRKSQGLRSRSQLAPGSLRVELDGVRHYSPRPVLTDDHVLVATSDELLALDRRDGTTATAASVPWDSSERGNLAAGPGLVVSASNRRLTAYLDLAVLEARAVQALADAPDDDGAALDLARLLNRRARGEIDVNGYSSRALELLERSRETLDPRVANGRPALRQELVSNLLLEADVRLRIQQPDRALELLDRGLTIARNDQQERDLLLALLPIVRARDTDRWLAALESLSAEYARLDLAPERLVGDPDWAEFALLEAEYLNTVPVGAWALVVRAQWAEQRGRFADALDDWHAVLAAHGSVTAAIAPSGAITVGARATERIADLLAAGGQHLYRPFDERAERLLATALDRGDGDLLDQLPRIYPFADSIEAARRGRLALALDDRDVEALADAVSDLLSELDPLHDVAARTELLATYARGLGRAGNLDFERELLDRLAARTPDLTIGTGPLAGFRISDLAGDATRPQPAVDPPAAFDENILLSETLSGPWQLLGLPPVGANAPAGESPRPLMVVVDDNLQAFDVDEPGRPLWRGRPPLESLPVDSPERWTLTPSRVVVGSDGLLVAIDVSSGRAAWVHAATDGYLRAVTSTAGVVIAQITNGPQQAELVGIDAYGGATLWRTALPVGSGWRIPMAADGHLVVLEQETVGPSRACVLDPFTGALRGTVELPDKLHNWIDSLPWIQADRLILPSVLRRRVSAVDLEQLDIAWTIDLGDERDLNAILTHGERVFLVAEGNGIGPGAERGAVIEVDPQLGSRRTVYSLDRDDQLIGLRRVDRLELDEPLIFTVSAPSSSDRARLTALDLDRGRRWVQELATTEELLYRPDWARAVVSDSTVALFYAQRSRRSETRQRVWLDLFEREEGTRLGRRQIARDYEEFQSLSPIAHGDTLWLGCKSSRDTFDRIDLWRNE